MGSSALLLPVLLATLTTCSVASYAEDLASEGVGFRKGKGGSTRGRAKVKGSAAPDAAKPDRFGPLVKSARNNNKRTSTNGSAAPNPGTPFPTDDETYTPTPKPSAIPSAPPVEEVEEASAPAEVEDTTAAASLTAGMPPCPPAYDPAHAGYAAGDTVEMESHVFVCQTGDYAAYCGVGAKDPAWDDATQRLWQNSWYHVEPCQRAVPGPTTEDLAVMTAAAVTDPDALYDDMAWGDLPGNIQDAMAVLGYTEELWEGGGTAVTDGLNWNELDGAEQAAAAALGYTPALWMAADDEETVVVAAAADAEASGTPTSYPTYASRTPTFAPTGTPPPCPPRFTAATTYVAGDVVEVEEHVFQCNTVGEGLYEKYCNTLHWNESLLEDNLHAEELWGDAWVHLGMCTLITEDFEGSERR